MIEFQRATRPLLGMLDGWRPASTKYGTDEELQRYLRDVTDHLTQVVERVDGFRHLLQNILTVNATLVSQQQNEEMRSLTAASYAQNEEIKKVSAWAAILFAPTLIGTVYGMNFDAHAGAALALRLPVCARDDGPCLRHPLHDLQTARLVVNGRHSMPRRMCRSSSLSSSPAAIRPSSTAAAQMVSGVAAPVMPPPVRSSLVWLRSARGGLR